MEIFVDSGGPNLHVDRLSHSNVCGMLGVGEHSAIKFDVKKQLLFGIGNYPFLMTCCQILGAKEAPIWV